MQQPLLGEFGFKAIKHRRTGLESAPILSMIETIQLMTNQIHSAYGVSTGHGPKDWEFPFQGILQGNQSSWAITSSPMFKMLQAEGYVPHFRIQNCI